MKIPLEIKQLSDTDLLEYLCSNGKEEDDGHAYSEFVDRYIKDVRGLCESICKKRSLDRYIGQQIAHDAFEKIRHHKSFKKGKKNQKDERKAILGFMYVVCVNLFNDHHRKQLVERNEIILPTYFDTLSDQIEVSGNVETNREIRDITQKLLKKLNPKELKVLLTDLEYKKHHKYLPDDVIESLAEELKVKPNSIRKIRERAIAKIKKEIDVINEKR